jgi:hypothetical protein
MDCHLPPCNKNDVHGHDMLPHHLTKCFTDYFNILHSSARNYMCSMMMNIDRNMYETCTSFLNVLMCVLE